MIHVSLETDLCLHDYDSKNILNFEYSGPNVYLSSNPQKTLFTLNIPFALSIVRIFPDLLYSNVNL